MIPLRDANPSRTTPVVTYILILINALVFLYQLKLGKNLDGFFHVYAIIPAKYFYLGAEDGASFMGRFFPFFTSQFLHGGFFHIIGNMWFLWIFGDNIEDHLGHFKFIFFYLLCGVAAGLTHVYTNPSSQIPTVGASGAIAGVMGAYILLYPRARVKTLIPIFYFIQIVELPAFLFLGIWFVIQFISGAISHAADGASGGVAWWAHVGGFVMGIVLILILPKRKEVTLSPKIMRSSSRNFFDD
ncbi:MAG: rhomboid family intramembrane serine protease [bacterium]|nr:rhomboid family intramembrane serine protease [bacterium]